MNMQIGFAQGMDSIGQSAANISSQVAYNLAPILELLGVASVRLTGAETMTGNRYAVSEVDFFEDVPQEIIRWSEPAIKSIAEFMSSLGILSIYITVDNDTDKESLKAAWRSITNQTPSGPKPEVKSWGMADDALESERTLEVDHTEFNHEEVEDTGVIVL